MDAAQHFRHVLSHFPTGVVVVTGNGPAGPAGLAVGSFSSVSLVPPLVGFYLDRASTSWPLVRPAGRFCVNVLAHDQVDLCRRFARSGGDKFAGLDWRPSPQTGAPVLAGVVAWVDCDLEREISLGDHELVVGAVTELGVERTDAPLIFLRGEFAALEAAAGGRA